MDDRLGWFGVPTLILEAFGMSFHEILLLTCIGVTFMFIWIMLFRASTRGGG